MGSDGPGRGDTAGGGSVGPEQLDLTRPDAYGRAFDDVYDAWYGSLRTAGDLPTVGPCPGGAPGCGLDAMVRFVGDRCPSGLVIELGTGSGRLAVPLLQAGLQVLGVDASLPMLSRCPPEVDRILADMSRLPFPSTPRPAASGWAPPPTFLCGFNTLFNLASADGLERLLAAVTGLQATFVVEMMNIDVLPPDPIRSTDLAPFQVPDGVVVSATSADVPNRRLAGRHLEITDRGVVSRPWLLRLVGHDELDQRAAGHGLRVIERYRSWATEPFRTDDPTSISVYSPDVPAA